MKQAHIHLFIIPVQKSSVAQWKRAGPITQRSMDRNHPLLTLFFSSFTIVVSRILIVKITQVRDIP